MPEGISAHGTDLDYEPTPGGAFSAVAEVGDLVLPGFMRNEHDTTPHNRNIDSNVLGVLRREGITFPLFFNKANASHAGASSLMQLGLNEPPTLTGFRITTPDGFELIFSGRVKDFKWTAPVDGVLTANVTLRATGPMKVDGTIVGA